MNKNSHKTQDPYERRNSGENIKITIDEELLNSEEDYSFSYSFGLMDISWNQPYSVGKNVIFLTWGTINDENKNDVGAVWINNHYDSQVLVSTFVRGQKEIHITIDSTVDYFILTNATKFMWIKITNLELLHERITKQPEYESIKKDLIENIKNNLVNPLDSHYNSKLADQLMQKVDISDIFTTEWL